ncbi:MAG: TetR family transcriptional regulator [Actinomycetia bacterium]|nr:TetR family transcriptional regulator [Actinomycetes bacterium]
MDDKPIGREAVSSALVDAAVQLIVERGTDVSVREIAALAGVNHGLVHTYFGSKQGLFAAAFEELTRRTAADLDPDGFPPPDAANRRGGELAKAIARVRLEGGQNPFPSHPLATAWRDALARTRPDLTTEDIDSMVITASVLGLGWAVFADHLCEILDVGETRRAGLDKHMVALIAELGGIPEG